MRIFKFSALVTVSAYTEIEADTLEKAFEEADSREVVFGGMGAYSDSNEMWVVDEIDGIPEEITCDSQGAE